jgi:hypothetical protein
VEPIVVPAPPRSAYNHNRRISDLLLSQLKHFQHVEKKSGDFGIDPEIARNIHTEAGAAKYIAAVTTTLRARGIAGTATQPALSMVPAKKPAKQSSSAEPLAIAAVAAKTSTPKNSAAKKAAPKGKR